VDIKRIKVGAQSENNMF